MVIAVISSVLSLFISACAAFAFSRYRFKGRRTGMLFILLVQMFPQFLAIVAIYLMFVDDHRPVPGDRVQHRRWR